MIRHSFETRALQTAVFVFSGVPVFAGVWDVVHSLAGAGAWAINHERYLSGLLFGIGIGFLTTIPDIERKTVRFRTLTFVVAVGGLCRLLGVLMGDPLSAPVAAALVMELFVTPALCLFQARVVSSDRHAGLAHFSP